jgi:uncharacterized membrane protein YoaK (UPF0700 family)
MPSTRRDVLLVALTLATGAVDAIAFLALGKVFTAFQTGNLVFAGIGLVDAGGPDLLRVAFSLGAFFAGTIAVTRFVAPTERSGVWPAHVTRALGFVLVLHAAFVVLWVAVGGWPGTWSAHALAAMSGLAMGIQSGAIRSLAVTGIFTTAATATLIFLGRNVADPAHRQPWECARLAAVLAALIAGAAGGGLLLLHAREWAPALPLVVTALVVASAGYRSGAPGGIGMAAATGVPPSAGHSTSSRPSIAANRSLRP